jgi:ABC-type multidrug transport system fused ATPase/permease subunit
VSADGSRPRVAGTVRALLPYAVPVRRALIVGLVLALVEVGIGLAQPWPLQWVVDNVLRPAEADPISAGDPGRVLLAAALAYLALVSVAAVVDYWSTRLLAASGLQLGTALRGSVFGHLQRLSLRYHGRQSVGDLSTRVTGDVDRTQEMLVQLLAVLVPNALLVVGMAGVMLLIDPWFTVIALAPTPLLAIATYRAAHQLKAAARSARRAEGKVSAAATENLGAINVVQAFSLERSQDERFADLSGSSLRANLKAVRLQARFSPVVDVTGALSVALVLWLGAHRVLAGQMTLGVLLVFMSYLASLYKPIKQLAKLSATLSKGAAAAERVLAVLGTEPVVSNSPRARVAPRLRGAVALDRVVFSHGREAVLQGVSLGLEPGENVALVGRTGSGKSTLAALVPRLMDPDRGVVSVDGIDVREIELASLRGQVAMVLQDTVLLRGTLRDNIAWGRPGASEREILAAARRGLVDEFAGRLPDGLDTTIGERGANLSGGQRQRVAIARAILRDAPILILDEPTSALDPQSEEMLVEALAALPGNRTTLVIAHRLSTIRRADRIVVLEGGRIAEQGSREDLLGRDGAYRRLAGSPAAVRL